MPSQFRIPGNQEAMIRRYPVVAYFALTFLIGNSEAIVACRLCRWDSIQFSRIIGNSSGIHRHW